ncbi:Uncharacterised protein [Mycobacterium tuberculosis]|uniref:Uncharacterized protein n=1 Tax=Mycobacterium tuberculosis TaxID=1773 RepID=A0A0U0SDH6_MYCTX|nr:Uncharacterised protein [Mycobacterium tuberculosis]COW67819.1 Uncharacterised protein [Mycobacterium tuberculosis]COX21951.1 Uncharacterised protein [Mycobacterium tuberculosis]
MDFCPFQQLTLVDELLKAGGVDEVVVDTVDLARAWRPRRGRDTEMQIRDPLAQTPNHRGFADRGRTGQHHHTSHCRRLATRGGLGVRSLADAHWRSWAGSPHGAFGLNCELALSGRLSPVCGGTPTTGLPARIVGRRG